MINDVRILKALADENRLRLLLLLQAGELFVCQLMAVTGLSQSLVSRSMALLEREGLVESRRQGKHVFYRLSATLPPIGRAIMETLDATRPGMGTFASDRRNLDQFCRRFQKGRTCDMGMIRDFIAFRKQKINKEHEHGKTGQAGVH